MTEGKIQNNRTNLNYALKYATNLNLRVFPIHYPVGDGCSCGNINCDSIGKHPKTYSGFKEATISQDQIMNWWTADQKSNIGILTENNFCVLDIDVGENKNGNESLALLIETYGELPETLIATTGSGGTHYFFKYSGDETLSCRTNIVDSIDFKGNGGYIVAAPSLHESGNIYSWNNDNQLAEIPEWLVDMVLNKSKLIKNTTINQPSVNSHCQNKIHNLSNYSGKKGDRNEVLFKLGSSMREKYGFDENQLFECLNGFNNSFNEPLNNLEVKNIAIGICNSYAAGTIIDQNNVLVTEDNGNDLLNNLFEKCKQMETGNLLGWALNKFKQIANNIDGIQSGFYLIPGEAGSGKTMFLVNLFLDIIQSNKDVTGYYISLDDPSSTIIYRSLACMSGVTINEVQKLKGSINENKVSRAKDKLSNLFKEKQINLFDISKVQHIDQLKALAKQASLKKEKFFIMIDGVYNLGVGNHGEARNENIKRANQLKELSDVYDIPLICTAEVRKSDGKSKGSRVLTNNDIMESGKYIFNANTIWILNKVLDKQGYFNGQLRLVVTKNKLSSFGEDQMLRLNTNTCLVEEDDKIF